MSWPPEMVLLPGILLAVLACVGVFWSCWSVRARVLLAAATAAVGVLSLGTGGPRGGRWTYLPLFEHAPGWSALRTPGRLVLWVTLGLCLLAAGTITRLNEAGLAWPAQGRLSALSVRVA